MCSSTLMRTAGKSFLLEPFPSFVLKINTFLRENTANLSIRKFFTNFSSCQILTNSSSLLVLLRRLLLLLQFQSMSDVKKKASNVNNMYTHTHSGTRAEKTIIANKCVRVYVTWTFFSTVSSPESYYSCYYLDKVQCSSVLYIISVTRFFLSFPQWAASVLVSNIHAVHEWWGLCGCGYLPVISSGTFELVWKESQEEKYPRLLFFFRKKNLLTFQSIRMPCKAAFFSSVRNSFVRHPYELSTGFFFYPVIVTDEKVSWRKEWKKKLASPPITERLDESFFFSLVPYWVLSAPVTRERSQRWIWNDRAMTAERKYSS